MRIFDFPKSNTENSAKLNERKTRMGITAGMRKPCTERRQQLQTIWFRYSLNPEGNLTCYPSSVLSIFLTVKTINDMQCTCGKKPEGTKASSGIWPQPLASARNFLRTKEYIKVRYFTTGLVHSSPHLYWRAVWNRQLGPQHRYDLLCQPLQKVDDDGQWPTLRQ